MRENTINITKNIEFIIIFDFFLSKILKGNKIEIGKFNDRTIKKFCSLKKVEGKLFELILITQIHSKGLVSSTINTS